MTGAYFVTGSGTDVGKTFVTAGLIGALRAAARAVDALKPVVSGFDQADMAGSDPAVLLEALGRPATANALERLSPWRFAAPLSPDMAAAREGRTIAFREVVTACQTAVAAADVLLIEGAGGLMVPLSGRETFLDLMAALRLPLIFVAGSYLGAISHALTALACARARGLAVRVTVLNESPGSPVTLEETRATLARFDAAPIVTLRRGEDGAAALKDLAAEL